MTIYRKNRNRRRMLADQLATALRHDDDHAAAACEPVAVARALAARPLLGEATRWATREHMLRIYDLAGKDTDTDAGSRDNTSGGVEVHTAVVDLPYGYAVLADMDRIDGPRAARIVKSVLGQEVSGSQE